MDEWEYSNMARWSIRGRGGGQLGVWTQDWLVCMSKACFQANYLLSLGIS